MARPCTPDGKRNLISARLVELRKEHNLSQRELAHCLQLYGIDKNAITRIETNKRYVTDIELRAIAHVFNVSYASLIDTPAQSDAGENK